MNKETAIAFVRLIVTMIVMVTTALGIAIDPYLIINIVGVALSFVCLLWTWWKNNNVTQAATEAQGVLDAIKDGSAVDFEVIDNAVEADEPGGE